MGTTELYIAEYFLEAHSRSNTQTFPPVMEAYLNIHSCVHTKESATAYYSASVESSPHLNNLFKFRFNIVFHLHLAFQSGLYPSDYPTKRLGLKCIYHLPILSSLISSHQYPFVKSKNY
jgi:hypothetical protein